MYSSVCMLEEILDVGVCVALVLPKDTPHRECSWHEG